MDMYLLHKQKQELYYVVMNPRIHRMSDKTYDALRGLLHFLDACTDAVDVVCLTNKCPWCGCQLNKNTRGRMCTSQQCNFRDYE